MKKITPFFLMITSFFCLQAQQIEIFPMTSALVPKALQIFMNAIVELQVIPCSDVQELEDLIRRTGEIKDFEDIEKYYTNNNGIFLALCLDGQLVGMGAIKKFSDDICELKRMFFAPKGRGKGLGALMLSTLLELAKKFGYQKIRLDTYNPQTQTAAIALYKKFGFYEIEKYNTSDAKLYMEKEL